MEIKDRIIKGRVKLQKENPFFAYMVAHLNMQEDESIGSIGVDNKGSCFYNPKWIAKISDNEIMSVLCHEVLHLALEHLDRADEREHKIWNMATDLVINNVLINNNFKLPKGLTPYNNEFKITDKIILTDLDKKVAEEVYNELKKYIKKVKEVGFDNHKFFKKGKKKDKKWKKVLTEASVYAKQQGKLPSGIERLVDLVLNEKVNWKQLLYKYITRELPFDYTYNRPSKKSISTGFYMPSILKENMNIVVSVDTSGSIEQSELSEFLSEIINITKSFKNIKVTLIVCDCEIKDVYEVSNGNIETIRDLKIKGGGGTSHIPIYEYIEKNLPHTKFLINFTDGFTDFPPDEVVKTIWVITSNGCKEEDIPFGEVIKLN